MKPNIKMVIVNNSTLNFKNLAKQFDTGADDFVVGCEGEIDASTFFSDFESTVLLVVSGCFGN